MENFDRKKHWENIYLTKELKYAGWFQQTPTTSLDFIKEFSIPTSAKIIDIGGGDSFLVDSYLTWVIRILRFSTFQKQHWKEPNNDLAIVQQQ